jgi:mono/diheme cytochrome c family protein
LDRGLSSEQALGAELFASRCQLCHGRIGTGTMMLEHRLGKDKALLAERNDLSSDYIGQVARRGLGSMPRLTRVDVSDEQLLAITAYLTRRNRGQ